MLRIHSVLVSNRNMSLKPIVSNTRILFSLLPGLGAMILLRLAIHVYRPDIEDADNRVRDYPFEHLYDCYDFIIVGGGSAGSVLASRLSENIEWNVLLLEAGSDENVLSEVPVLFPILQTSSIDWQFVTEPSSGYCLNMIDTKCKWPRGKVLGGSSVLNAMLYIRGNKHDYDYWANMGNIGWSWDDVFPYFLKSEDMTIPEYKSDPYHAQGGPLTIEYFNYEQPITRKILEAGEQLGYKVLDVNGEHQTGFTRSHATVREGLRCSTAKAFLRPASKRGNLHVSLFSLAEKVVIDEHKRAYGVQFRKNGIDRIIKASKEVILSAGAIQSPQLLMLSGIGDAEHLKEVGLHPIVNLPGVGRNLQDHVAMGGHSFLFDNPYTNGTEFCFNLRTVLSLGNLIDFVVHKTGPLYSMMEAEAMAFVNTKYADPKMDYPDIQLFIAPTADNMDGGLFGKRANGLDDETYAELYEDILYESSFSIVPLLLRPKSRGYISLRDANPFSPPRIYPNYFSHPDDLKVLIEGARIVQKLTEMPALRELNSRPNPHRNPGCAAHDLMSDDHLECQARHHSLTIYHPVGTCAMGPSTDPDAVVDPRLRVYGIKNLRVVDASIMPAIISGNTNAPTIMIAEKASDMIKEDWKEVNEDNVNCEPLTYRQNAKGDVVEPPNIPNEEANLINETSKIFPNLSPVYHSMVNTVYDGKPADSYPVFQREYETRYKEVLSAPAHKTEDKNLNYLRNRFNWSSLAIPRKYSKVPPQQSSTQSPHYQTNIVPDYVLQPMVHVWPNFPQYQMLYTPFEIENPSYYPNNVPVEIRPYYPNRNYNLAAIPPTKAGLSANNDPYYEYTNTVTQDGRTQCRVWLHYNGNKYELFI